MNAVDELTHIKNISVLTFMLLWDKYEEFSESQFFILTSLFTLLYLLLLFSLFSIIYKIVNNIHIYENLEEFKIIVASFRFLRLPPMSWVCFSLLELDLDISEIVSSFGWACSDCEGSLLDLILMTAWLFNFDFLTASAETFSPPPACLLEFEQQLSLLQGFVQYSIWNIANRRPKPYQNKVFWRHYVW